MTPAQEETALATQGDAASARPGALSALLAELAEAPAVQLDGGWERHLHPGATVGRFELVREIGRGGFGVVYEARDRELGRRVAFKAIRPGTIASGHDAAWLRDEADAIARLQHPNIVTLFDAGRCDSGPYLILELLEGETLHDRLRRGPVPRDEALRIAHGIAAGLAHAHAAGVVHRDLKPANVLLARGGAVKILDFGLAHVFGRGGLDGGTRGFIPPEGPARDGDPRADVWAAGAVLHLLLAGAPPGPDGAASGARLPRPLRGVLAAALAADPARRLADGAALERAIAGAERALSPRRRRFALLAAGAIVAGALAGLAAQRLAAEAERLTVAVADLQNRTGDGELDALAGLLVTSLEQSPRLRVLPRARLLDLLAQAGRRDLAALDEPVVRDAAVRADAGAVLAGSVGRERDRFRIEVRGVEPRTGDELFRATADAARKEDVPSAVDALARRARRALRESAADVRASEVQVAQAVTANLEAYRHYALGQQCLDRPSESGSWQYAPPAQAGCARELEAALAIDPEFPLGHYALAWALRETNGDPAPHIAAALRGLDRVPPKERTLIRALDATLRHRRAEAFALYARIIDAFPDDKRAISAVGELMHHDAGDFAAAIPFFERALALDPELEWGLDHLPQELGALGRRDELRAHVATWEASAPSLGVLHALSSAYGWLGEHDHAIAAARRAVALGGARAREDLVQALLAGGREGEAQAEVRDVLAAEGARAPLWATYALAELLAREGRSAEALGAIDALAAHEPPVPAAAVAGKRMQLLAGSRDVAALARACDAAGPAGWAAPCAVLLAYAGDLAAADGHARAIEPGTPADALYAALLRWRGGDGDGAAAALREADRRYPIPQPFSMPAPSYLLAELLAARGDAAGAAEAARRFVAQPAPGLWRGWAVPRALALAAGGR